jgi:hypothetical protein
VDTFARFCVSTFRVLERAAAREPDAVKGEVGLLDDHVVVVVIVQHPEAVPVGKGSDEQIDGGEAVMSDEYELRLRVEGRLLGRVVEVVLGEGCSSARSWSCSRALRAE